MFSISLPLVLSTFGIIFLAELPDKTALSSLVLATRHGARPVIVGAWLAMLVQTIIAVLAGGLLNLLPHKPVHIIAGIAFLVFAYLAIRRKEEKEEAELKKEEKQELKKGRPAWLATFLVLFGAEWGDLSQLATAGIVAQQGHPLSVGIGAVLGLWLVVTLAAVAGSQLNRFLSPQVLNKVSAVLFAAIGVGMLYTAFI